MTNNEINIESHLNINWELTPSLFTQLRTKTHFLLLPLVLSKQLYENMRHFYVNSYIADEEKEKTKSHVVLIELKVNNINGAYNKEWNYIFNKLVSLPNYAYHYYTGNNGIDNLAIFVMDIDPLFTKDFDYILEGKYSFTSLNYQKRILFFFSKSIKLCELLTGFFTKEEWVIKEIEQIINHPVPRTNEYWDAFNYQREIYKSNEYRKIKRVLQEC